MADQQYNPPSLEDFRSFSHTTGFARVNRFAVDFAIPPGLSALDYTSDDARKMTMLCEEASIPGKQLMPRMLRINALSEPRAHTVDYWNDTASFQFLIDNDWSARAFFEDWISLATGNGRTREIGNYEDYNSPVTIHSLSPITNFIGVGEAAVEATLRGEVRNKLPFPSSSIETKLWDKGRKLLNDATGSTPEKVLWSVQLIEAWPRSITIAPVSYSNTTFHRMVVTFMYKYWVSLDDSGNSREDRIVGTFPSSSTTDAATPANAAPASSGTPNVLGIDTATELRKLSSRIPADSLSVIKKIPKVGDFPLGALLNK